MTVRECLHEIQNKILFRLFNNQELCVINGGNKMQYFP